MLSFKISARGKGNSMSERNGDRSRFHRQRRTKLHNRTRIRELRKTLRLHKAGSEQ